MERKWLAICGLTLGTICLSHTIPTTFAFDKPLFTSNILLASAAFTLFLLPRFLQADDGAQTGSQEPKGEGLPMIKVRQEDAVNDILEIIKKYTSYYRTKVAKWRWRYILICAITLRVETLRIVLATTQCTALSWEPLIPLILTCLETWEHQRQKHGASSELHSVLTRSKLKHLATISVFSLSALATVAFGREPQSTFICAATFYHRWFVPMLHRIGTALDVTILHHVTILLEQDGFRLPSGHSHTISGRMTSLASIMNRSTQLSAFWSFILWIYYSIIATKPGEGWRMFELPSNYSWSLVKLTLFSCLTLCCGLLSITYIGMLSASMLCTLLSILTITTMSASSHFLAFPPLNNNIGFIAVSFLIVIYTIYVRLSTIQQKTRADETIRSTSNLFNTRIPSWFYLVMLILFFGRTALWAMQSKNCVNYHPIDMLTYNAQLAHDAYVQQASASRTLQDATIRYRARYSRHPPPGFDHWYRYATERKSVIIDDFDNVHHNLLPYYALSPEDIRDRTKQLLQTRWHNATGISIRDGKTAISTHVNDDHRWMMEAVAGMIGKFSEWLPDMDLVFNIDDECRIAVPWQDLNRMRQEANQVPTLARPHNAFSSNRAAVWEPVSSSEDGPKVMTDLGWQAIFHSHGSAHCPPGSAARNQRHWDKGEFCTSCAAPHSLGAFLANWTDATNVCHQPDLAGLHGFYMAPSAFKNTHELLPLFSQSAAPGFNDIVYPSVWNWLGKVKHAPSDEYPDVPFAHKNDTLFWRGVTSEGFSPDRGQWQGMSRQRFLHILNDINVAGTSQALLLPHSVETTPRIDAQQQSRKKQRYSYTNVPISTLTSLIRTDVRFVNRFIRCWDIDCAHQAAEYALTNATNFQAHWQYKYLLDLDGAGFSGRFLPFMFSHSLPFKAALFREWWDDRLTAWKHFVPLDLRAHGVWATLAYFTGMDGKVNGKNVKVEPHVKEGERIAENGREWAQKVLRKEDMEIYFFRLLLEWGRLTDDGRDVIGFSVDDIPRTV